MQITSGYWYLITDKGIHLNLAYIGLCIHITYIEGQNGYFLQHNVKSNISGIRNEYS